MIMKVFSYVIFAINRSLVGNCISLNRNINGMKSENRKMNLLLSNSINELFWKRHTHLSTKT